MTESSPDPERLDGWTAVRSCDGDVRFVPPTEPRPESDAWTDAFDVLLAPRPAPTHQVRADEVPPEGVVLAEPFAPDFPIWLPAGTRLLEPTARTVAFAAITNDGGSGSVAVFQADAWLTVEGPEPSRPDTVTVELERGDVEWWAARDNRSDSVAGRIEGACRAALAATDPTEDRG